MYIISLIIIVFVILFILKLFIQNIKKPTHLGHVQSQLAAMPTKPNAVSSQTNNNDMRVEPLEYKSTTNETMKSIKSVLKVMGKNEVIKEENHYLYVVFTTGILHFHDDVEVLLDEQHKIVHFRSQSRAGYSDLGVNRKRYEAFKVLYNQ
jgi:uncharacterized protein (DUF1499 family)